MFGAILGDIIGSRFEFSNHEIKKDFELFTKHSVFTDDTVMTIAIADGLMSAGRKADEKTIKEKIIKSMKKYGQLYPDAGYGSRFYYWLKEEEPKPYGSYGNGSAMRVSSVAWLYDSVDRVMEVAKWTAEVSHNHPEGIKGAVCTAVVTFLARIGKSKNEIRNFVLNNFDYDISETLAELRKRAEHVESCMDSLPKALVSFFEGNSYEDVIRNAISLGGDTDTLAAIAGAMAEAYYGISEELKDEVFKRLKDDELTKVLKSFRRIKIEDPLYGKDMDEVRNAWIANYAEMLNNSKTKEEMMENYLNIINLLSDRYLDNEEVLVPCIDVNNTLGKINNDNLNVGDIFNLKEELRLKVDLVKDEDNNLFMPFYSSLEEINKKPTTGVRMKWPVKALIEDAYNLEEIKGLVINPFSDRINLSKEVLNYIIKQQFKR